MHRCIRYRSIGKQWRIQRGGKSGHAPIEVGKGVRRPLWGRKNNDSIVKLAKCKNFALLPYRHAWDTDLANPLRKMADKNLKRSLTKKRGHQKFLEIDDIFCENAEFFLR